MKMTKAGRFLTGLGRSGSLLLFLALSCPAFGAGTLVQIQANGDVVKTANPLPVTGTITSGPATTGGLSMYSANVTTAGSGAGTGGVAVDATVGQVYGYAIYNGNASVCYAGFYDQTQALTNLGTTVPKAAIGIPANGGANVFIDSGLAFATAITISATTTRAGSTACSTGLDFNIWYK
jgi:hypothetical protein